MKVLLLKDVYNLGRAGDTKKVANGFGRNFLIPQRLAVLATPGALKQSDRIRAQADKRRNLLNEELASVASQVSDLQLQFPAKAGETGKLYGSVTTQLIAKQLSDELNLEISKRQIDSQPLRLLGLHTLRVHLTIDLIPEFSVVVFREGEPPENYMVAADELASQAETLVVEAEIEAAQDESDEQTSEGDDEVQTETSAESDEQTSEGDDEVQTEMPAESEDQSVEEEPVQEDE